LNVAIKAGVKSFTVMEFSIYIHITYKSIWDPRVMNQYPHEFDAKILLFYRFNSWYITKERVIDLNIIEHNKTIHCLAVGMWLINALKSRYNCSKWF
jgi:hypothetical protein